MLHPLGGAMNYVRTYVRNPVWRLLARFCLQPSYTCPESRAIRADRGDACQPTASPHSHVAPLKADLLHSTYVRTSSDGLPTYVRTYIRTRGHSRRGGVHSRVFRDAPRLFHSDGLGLPVAGWLRTY